MPEANPYAATFDRLEQDEYEGLWEWQFEVLGAASQQEGDVAIELPTGSGKTVTALVVCEEYRRRTGKSVAYLTGTKQLTQQVVGEAECLGVPAVQFHGSKHTWSDKNKTDYEFGVSVGVMNYWNYFNEAPGVNPAGLLVLDDVHLAEGPLRDFFSVFVSISDPLCVEALRRIQTRFGYYGLVNDLLDDLNPSQPAEMLSPLDSLEIADAVGQLLDEELEDGSPSWWAWKRVRARAQSCCWLVSSRGLTITPWIPPSQTIDHFREPERRLYLSATVGDPDDLRRRIGCPKLEKISAAVPPQQGKRFVALMRSPKDKQPEEIVLEARELIERSKKSLWLCARSSTADRVEDALEVIGADPVNRLASDNGAADIFGASARGHLVCAGRYDGMDFPDDVCRLEILPEAPVATSDLEEFISAYLRDAGFAQARFAQRVAQALGRCNRSKHDRAAYLLWDPAFFSSLGNRQGLGLLPADIRADVFAGVRRSGDPADVLKEAESFLGGGELSVAPETPILDEAPAGASAKDEVDGVLSLWGDDFSSAATHFGRVARGNDGAGELRGFWLAMQAMAQTLAAKHFDDRTMARKAPATIAASIAAGGANTFFSRMRASQARAAQEEVIDERARNDRIFAAWDAVLDRRRGKQLERWRKELLADLDGSSHDAVSRAIGEVGRLLGLGIDVPKAKDGEHDVLWELSEPHRKLLFEVKLAPGAKKTSIKDVNQAEGAVRALKSESGNVQVRGALVTPHEAVSSKAIARLERVRLLRLQRFKEFAAELVQLLGLYADDWSPDAEAREAGRRLVEPKLPDVEQLWCQSKGKAHPWIPEGPK